MDLDFSTIYPFFLNLTVHFYGKIITQWVYNIPVITCDKGIECYSSRIELFYFDDNFCHINIALWVSFRNVLRMLSRPEPAKGIR